MFKPDLSGYHVDMAVAFDMSRHFDSRQIAKLKEIAVRLTPHAEDIVNSWVDKQRAFEVTPSISREKMVSLFTMLFYGTLDALRTGNIIRYLSIELPIIGKSLVESGFPYEQLVITVHFLEESYLPYLSEVRPSGEHSKPDIGIYIMIDEFWHFWIAELTYAYFYEVKRTLSEEAQIGKSLQEAIVTRVPTTIGCMEIGTFYASATTGAMVGGDTYDIVNLDTRVQHILMSDFAGHGLRASIKAANIRAMFRGFAIEDDATLTIANRLNRVLYSELGPGEFDTAFLARFDQGSKEVRYVNAGHLGPVLISANNVFVLPEGENLALGMFKDVLFKEQTFTLEAESVLVIYTDGITEARRGNNFFGVEGIIASVKQNLDKDLAGIASGIWNDCLTFANGEVHDDAAILVLKCGQ